MSEEEMEPVVGYRERVYARYGQNFQDAATTFDFEASRRWGRGCRYYLRGWLPASKESRIVDLACGGGKLLHLFVDQGFHNVEGVDISSDQVLLSRQVTPRVSQANAIEFLESNVGAFDLITGFDIVEHFYKDEVFRFLDAAYGALRPGGRLILQTPNAEGPWGTQHRYNDFTHEVGFNPNSLTRVLRLVGFTEISARECGPAPLSGSTLSSIRYVLWRAIRLCLISWNLIETGARGSGVLTRVFVISGRKLQA